jgi:hypothetical protein
VSGKAFAKEFSYPISNLKLFKAILLYYKQTYICFELSFIV